ncbi:putative leader peptide [Actinomadura sp. 3N508]
MSSRAPLWSRRHVDLGRLAAALCRRV